MLDALEVAVTVARRDAATRGAPAPPRPLRAVLHFSRLPEKALQVVRRSLDDDEDFRRRVAEAVDPDELSRGGRLFLERPEGWREELDLLVELELEEQGRARAEELRGRVTSLERDLALQRRQIEDAERAAREARAQAERAEGALASSAGEREALARELEDARAGRAGAVRQLKAAEALAARRLEELRRAVPAAPSAAAPPAAAADAAALDALDSARDELLAAAGRARELAERLEAAAEALGPPGEVPSAGASPSAGALSTGALPAGTPSTGALSAGTPSAGTPSAGTPSAGTPSAGTPSAGAQRSRTGGARRVPRRLGRGLVGDSAEGLAQLLGIRDMVVLIDGYNVSMAGWPAQPVARQRDCLLELLRNVVANRPAELHVVFDGAGAGERPAVTRPLPVRVHFTEAGVEADDRLIELAHELPPSRPVTIVSSDRRVRDGARREGANVVSSAALLELGRR